MRDNYTGSTRLSFILPTIGRPTLERAIKSITAQPLVRGDEIIIVGDFIPTMPWMDTMSLDRIKFIECPRGNDWGRSERTRAIAEATGTHLVFIDDDDALLPHAVANICRATDRHPGRPIMFRMVDPNGAVLWADPEVRMGNHGSPCFVPPNHKSKLGKWTERREGDFDFCTSTLALYPAGALVWDSSIIYACRDQVEHWAAAIA